MSARPPMIRPCSGVAVLVTLAVVGAFTLIFRWWFHVREWSTAILLAAVAHIIYGRLMRSWLTRDHRVGIALFRERRFAEAAPRFEASYRAMVDRPWIDRFRWLILGGASELTYREMALCNAAFCYSQIGDGQRALGLYEQALKEFPGSSIATASLNMLNSIRHPADSAT